SYIEIINESDAVGPLAALYKRYSNPDSTVDNVLKVHSLNPESLDAHCALYIQACHRPGPVSRAEREMVGVTVSRINGCTYCQTHHAKGLEKLLPKDRKHVADEVFNGDETNLTERERAMCAYGSKLTRSPAAITKSDIDTLRGAGLSDREILDVAQVAAYFAYANRIVLGLGAALEHNPDALGHAPAESN
ncbi:MAG: peroxidase-related enzyme, partial [Phycisphaerales bacterium]|nr:peroxidase-related enzyme [Phycisphaerales bacterium]